MPQAATHIPRKKIVFTLRGKLEDIIATIMYADQRSAQYVEGLAEQFRSSTIRDTAFKVWHHWKYTVPYQEDPPGKQDIQSPGELWRNRYASICNEDGCGTGHGGDCKSYSIACGAIFQVLGIPYKYRFISENADAELHHVYLIVDDTIPVDCVNDPFGVEIPHDTEVDMQPNTSAIKGPMLYQPTLYNGQAPSNVHDLSTMETLDDVVTTKKTIWKPIVAIGISSFLAYKIFA